MQRSNISSLLVVLFSLVFFCGAADVKLTDVQTAIIEQDYEKAQDLAETFIGKNPEKNQLIEAQYYLGISKLNQEKYADAREAFDQVLAGQPSRSFRERAELGKIDSYMLEGKYEEALSRAQKMLRESPQSEFLSLIYFKIARAHFRLAHWDTAAEMLKMVSDRFPDSPEAHLAKQLMEEKHYFAVQVGAFMDQGLAERMVQDLRVKEKYAYIVETVDKTGQKFYRVRIGQFSRLNEALAMARKISQLGYPTLIYP